MGRHPSLPENSHFLPGASSSPPSSSPQGQVPVCTSSTSSLGCFQGIWVLLGFFQPDHLPQEVEVSLEATSHLVTRLSLFQQLPGPPAPLRPWDEGRGVGKGKLARLRLHHLQAALHLPGSLFPRPCSPTQPPALGGPKMLRSCREELPSGQRSFPHFLAPVSERRCDVAQAHSWERRDGRLRPGQRPSHGQHVGLRFLPRSSPVPARRLHLGGRKATPRVDRGRSDPAQPDRKRPQAGVGAARPEARRISVRRGADRGPSLRPASTGGPPRHTWPRVQPRSLHICDPPLASLHPPPPPLGVARSRAQGRQDVCEASGAAAARGRGRRALRSAAEAVGAERGHAGPAARLRSGAAGRPG